jgi:YfiH family protein
VPVLLADREAGVVGAAHAGWKGARAGIVRSAVAAMAELGAKPERIVAAIGPSIAQASYEVGPDFREALLSDTPQAVQYFSDVPGQLRPHFDLKGFVKSLLHNSGVTSVEDLQVCTYQNESLLFSYRRSTHRGEPDYGRQISAILLS